MTAHLLGPSLKATVCTPDLARSIAAWQGSLHQVVHAEGSLTVERAAQLGASNLAGTRYAMMSNELNEPWLELIESPTVPVLDPFGHSGWFSLEINVANVDQLRTTLDESMFQVIGEPANLDVSDDIRAMQVIGPAGEVLYLTEIKADVPPFELPRARCAVDRLFIPVMLAEDRDAASNVYAQLNGHAGMKFETKITVINRARGLDVQHRHPVCTLQLAGCNLIEIDQLDQLQRRTAEEGMLPSGIAAITFAFDSPMDTVPGQLISTGNDQDRKHVCLRGAAGELIELINLNF